MSSESLAPPVLPPIENLFIPEVIDFNFKNNAEQPFFTFADAVAPTGVQFITHLEFGRAAHRVAHILRPDRSGPDGEVIAMLALSDSILYQTIVAGCMIAGLVPFPISPRNSPAAVVNLLEKTSCRRLIATNVTLKSLIDGVRAQVANTSLSSQLQVEEVPSLASAYPKLGHEVAEHPFEPYPGPVHRPSKDDVCIYTHSSGSTGFPKAIPQTHLAWQNWALLPGVSDFRGHEPRLTMGVMALPSFHTLGLYVQFLAPLYGILTATAYPPTATAPDLLPITPSPQNILEHARLTRSNTIVTIPTLLHVWSMSSEAIDFLATLESVSYSGGSLAPKLGNLLVDAGVRLRSIYGGTEFGAPSHLISREGEEKEWEYIRFSNRANVRWVPQGDGTFECQFLASERHLPMILNLPDTQGYATSDLFARHPKYPDLWKIVGRVDDVIVHASGEKTVPAPMEDIIMSSPFIQAAVMFGRERDQTGILIEPKPDHAIDVQIDEQVAAFRNKLWPVIEEANKVAPAFSRIFKETILISSKDKPLPRTGKGTVMRKSALAVYDEEISELYDAVESNIKTAQNIPPPASWALADVQAWIINQAADLLSSSEVSPSVDLFEQGFDSLSATFLRLRIVGALRASKTESIQRAAQALTQNLIYSYPIIQDLAAHVVSLTTSHGEALSAAAAQGSSRIEEIVEKYSLGLDGSPSTTVPARSTPAVVLLTGSTGNLGSEILAALLQDARVDHVYAFNRPSQGELSVQQRQLKAFKERGLSVELLERGKVSYFSGDATQSNLGLDRGQYGQLCRSVNVVIHNAWKLDFNLSLSAFEPNIQGTRHLIDLVKSGPNPSDTRFLFTSSISSAQSWPKSNGPYPEEVLTDASFAVGGGYGEGKYVAERILVRSGLQATSLRIGQISGGQPKGAWATTDWVPILVKSSVTVGSLPDIEGAVSWIPMDAVAAAIVDAALGDAELPRAANLVHPRPVEGKQVIKFIQSAIEEVLGRHLTVIPFSDWLGMIEEHAGRATTKSLADIPAIKLLDFFRLLSQGNDEVVSSKSPSSEAGGLATFSTEKMLRVGGNTMRELRSLGQDDVLLWVKYWQGVNYLK